MSPPTLETKRLTIRQFVPADQPPRLQLTREAFNPDYAESDNAAWLDWTIRNYRELARLQQPPYGDYAITLKEGGALIGSIGLVQSTIPWGVFRQHRKSVTPNTFVSPEFGLFWAIMNDQQRKGYAHEAAQAMIAFIFGALRARRVVATTEHTNLASQRVMQKLGMSVLSNPGKDPFWFEVVGLLDNPAYDKD